MLNGYDIDGVLTAGIVPVKPYVVISGRTFAEYDEVCKKLAHDAPVYIRGTGEFGDWRDAARFKAEMIKILGVTDFYEDDSTQALHMRTLWGITEDVATIHLIA